MYVYMYTYDFMIFERNKEIIEYYILTMNYMEKGRKIWKKKKKRRKQYLSNKCYHFKLQDFLTNVNHRNHLDKSKIDFRFFRK